MEEEPSPDAAREVVRAELAELKTRRVRAFAGSMGAFMLLCVLIVQARPDVLWTVVALYGSAGFALAAGLGVPLLSPLGTRILGVVALTFAVISVAVLATPNLAGDGIGLGCLAKGSAFGLAAAGILTVAFAPLWRRAVDLRWAVAGAAAVGSLAVLAWVCPHHHALHLWVSHLPIIPLVYAGARLAFGSALPHD